MDPFLGGNAPRALDAAWSGLTTAAARAAVDTIRRPRPRSSCGGVKDVTRADADPRRSITWEDAVFADGGPRRRGLGALRVVCGGELPQPLQRRRREGEVEAGLPAAEARREHPHLRVDRVDRLALADRIREPDSPDGLHRLDLGRLTITNHDQLEPQLVGSLLSAYGKLSASGGSRSRPPAATPTE